MTPPCYLIISQKITQDLITDPGIPSSHQAFKNALLEPLGELEGFWGQKPACLFARPCNKPFSRFSLTSLCIRHRNLCSLKCQGDKVWGVTGELPGRQVSERSPISDTWAEISGHGWVGQADGARGPGIGLLTSPVGRATMLKASDCLGLKMAALTSQAGLAWPGGGTAALPATCHAGHVCAPSSGGERCSR